MTSQNFRYLRISSWALTRKNHVLVPEEDKLGATVLRLEIQEKH